MSTEGQQPDDDFIRLDDELGTPVETNSQIVVGPIAARTSTSTPAAAPTNVPQYEVKLYPVDLDEPRITTTTSDDGITFPEDEPPEEVAVNPPIPVSPDLPVEQKTAPSRAPTPKSPNKIRKIMHNKAARLLVWGTLVGGAMSGAIYGANRIPLINGSANITAQKNPDVDPKAPAEIPSGTVVIPKSIDEAIKNGQIIITPEGKRKPAPGWEWTYEDVSQFPKDDMRKFSVTRQ